MTVKTFFELKNSLRLPLIASPMFLISNPKLVIAQCRSGIVGSFPTLNARTVEQLEEWLEEIKQGLMAANDKDYDIAPYAANLIVHKSNDRVMADLELIVKYKVPIVITSLGAIDEVYKAVKSYGGIVLHDVINQKFSHKAVDKGASGLIAVAHGAGGHAGSLSPFALVQELREWYDGPLLLSGSIATGRSILAAIVMGADLAYMGSPFIAVNEAKAVDEYKDMIAKYTGEDIIYTNCFTGVHGNYLIPSIIRAGLDPKSIASVVTQKMNFDSARDQTTKAWKDIWGCGQGIGAIKKRQSCQEFVDQLFDEYQNVKVKLGL